MVIQSSLDPTQLEFELNYLYKFLPLTLYFLILLVIIIKTRIGKEAGDASFFLADRKLNAFSSFFSVIATETSVATIVLFPAAGFKSGYALIWLCLGFILGRFIVSKYYLYKLYHGEKISIYATIAGNNRPAEIVISLFYLISKIISSGVRLFLGGYALQQLFHGHIATWIIFSAIIAGLYSLSGGLRAIVITDQLQGFLIIILGLFFAAYLFMDNTFSVLLQNITWINTEFTYDNPLFFIALFIYGTLISIGTHGADQDMIQRILAVKDFQRAKRALFLSSLGATFIIIIYLTIGILLRTGGGYYLNEKSPFIDFISQKNLPLFNGLLLVLLLAAAMSTLDSAINSMGAIWKAIFVNRISGRFWSFISLLTLVISALGFIKIAEIEDSFLALALGSMNYINGGLIAIFTMALFFPERLRSSGIIMALIGGCLIAIFCTWFIQPSLAWTWTIVLSVSGAFGLCFYGSIIQPEKK